METYLWYISLAPKYVSSNHEIVDEDPGIPALLGEDPDSANLRMDVLPSRTLSDFSVFDCSAGNKLVSLELCNNEMTQYDAAGVAATYQENEEDAGQENEDDEKLLLRMRGIRYWIEYEKLDGSERSSFSSIALD